MPPHIHRHQLRNSHRPLTVTITVTITTTITITVTITLTSTHLRAVAEQHGQLLTLRRGEELQLRQPLQRPAWRHRLSQLRLQLATDRCKHLRAAARRRRQLV